MKKLFLKILALFVALSCIHEMCSKTVDAKKVISVREDTNRGNN